MRPVLFVEKDASEGGSRTDGTFSHRSRVYEMPRRSVAFMVTFALRYGDNLYGFCLAWISDP
jgi:hypothetical protein